MIFSNANYELGFAGLFKPGRYNTDGIKFHHIDHAGNDGAASSLVIPSGMIATLFKGPYFGGD